MPGTAGSCIEEIILNTWEMSYIEMKIMSPKYLKIIGNAYLSPHAFLFNAQILDVPIC